MTDKSETTDTIKLQLSEILFFLYFALMLFAKGMGLYQGQWPYTLALGISAILIIAKILATDHTVLELGIIVLLLALGIAVYLSSGDYGAIILIATVIGMKRVSVERLMVLGMVVWTFSFVVKILLTLTGIQSDIFRVQSKLGLGHIIRWSLGQPHPNVLQVSYMLFCAFFLYVFRMEGRKLIRAVLVLFLGNLYFFMYSISYTGIALVTLFLVIYVCLDRLATIGKPLKVLMGALPVICVAFSILGPLYMPGKLWDICNKLLNTRFKIAQIYITSTHLSLFGTGYNNDLPLEYNNLDCSYVYALMHYGVIFFVIFVGGYLALVINLINQNKKAELAIVLSMCVAAISEPFFANTSFKNITLVFLGAAMYEGLERITELDKITEQKKISSLLMAVPVPGRKLCDKTFTVNVAGFNTWLESIKEYAKAHAKKIALVSLCIGIVAAAVFAVTYKKPSAYYMNRVNVQIIEGDYITMDINDLPDDFDGRILSYTDSETPMQRFDGNIIEVEYVRGIISMLLWVSLGTMLVYVLIGNGLNSHSQKEATQL